MTAKKLQHRLSFLQDLEMFDLLTDDQVHQDVGSLGVEALNDLEGVVTIDHLDALVHLTHLHEEEGQGHLILHQEDENHQCEHLPGDADLTAPVRIHLDKHLYLLYILKHKVFEHCFIHHCTRLHTKMCLKKQFPL